MFWNGMPSASSSLRDALRCRKVFARIMCRKGVCSAVWFADQTQSTTAIATQHRISDSTAAANWLRSECCAAVGISLAIVTCTIYAIRVQNECPHSRLIACTSEYKTDIHWSVAKGQPIGYRSPCAHMTRWLVVSVVSAHFLHVRMCECHVKHSRRA